MLLKKRIVREVNTTIEAEITEEEIRAAFSLPEDAEIFMEIPGGGDWSNEDLAVDKKRPLKARWKRSDRVEEEH